MEALAEQYRRSLASDFLLVADSHMTWLGRANWPDAGAPSWRLLTHGASPDAHGHSALVALSDGPYLVVLEPALFIDEVLGWLAAGYRLDDKFARGAGADHPRRREPHRRRPPVGQQPRYGAARRRGQAAHERRVRAAGLAATGERRVTRRANTRWRRARRAAGRRCCWRWIGSRRRRCSTTSRRGCCLIGLGAFVLAVGGTTVFCRRAARPLRDVVEAAHEITQGDWSRRVPVRGSSEAVAMAAAFNEMTSSLTTLNGQLAIEKARAVDASRAKDQLLSNMSHELRTPLNGIMGMTALALTTDLTGEQREYLDAVDVNAAALLAMVDDVLDFAKIDAGEVMLRPAPFDLHQCLEACRRSVSPAACAKGLALSLEVEPAVPATVVADEARLRQVALNLLDNAVKFTATGGVSLHATLEPAAGAAVLLHVEVRDTGIGIAAEKREQIFQPFAQGDGSMTREFGGTGLGLSIASRLVAAMGGRIWFESEPGAGSRFHFTATLDVA